MLQLARFLKAGLKSLVPWRPWLTRGDAPMPALDQAREILVIRLDEIGDFILTSAFLRDLRRRAPQARITLMVGAHAISLARLCPYADQILSFGAGMPHGGALQTFQRRAAVLRLRWGPFARRRFDLVLLPRRGFDYYDAEFVAHFLARGAPIAACRDALCPWPRPFGIAHYFQNSLVEHEVAHTLRFLGWCAGDGPASSDELEIWIGENDRASARDLVHRHFSSAQRPLLILHPSGGRSVLKQWPVARFQDLLRKIRQRVDLHCLVIGGADETWIREAFPSEPDAGLVNLAGELKLTQLAAVLAEADLFIGCDSGPMHLAAASGTPVVTIFGPTSQVRFRPLGPQAEVVSLHYACSPDVLGTYQDRCSSCIYDEPRCLTELPVDLVLAQVLARLEKKSG